MAGSNNSDAESLQAPLLEPYEGASPKQAAKGGQGLGLGGAVANLCKAIVGAGLLAVPRAFALLGFGWGSACLFVVAVLTVLMIDYGQVEPSTDETGALIAGTYGQMVLLWVGPRAKKMLSFTMMLSGLGFLTSYLNIMSDVLLGSPRNPGIVSGPVARLCGCNVFNTGHLHKHHNHTQPDLPQAGGDSSSTDSYGSMPSSFMGWAFQQAVPLAGHGTPAAASDQLASPHGLTGTKHALTEDFEGWVGDLLGWGDDPRFQGDTPFVWKLLLDRRVVLAVLVLAVMPLALRRNMGHLSSLNAVGLAALAVFLAGLGWLATAAFMSGKAHPIQWGPNWSELGAKEATEQGWEGQLQVFVAGFGVVSVLLTATGCQPNIHPLLGDLKPYSTGLAKRVVVRAVALCTVFYWLVAMCAWAVFGPNIEGDVLTNISVLAMAPLIGQWQASFVAYVVRLGYLLSILGSTILSMFPFRQAASYVIHDLFYSSEPASQRGNSLQGPEGTAPTATVMAADVKDRFHVPLSLGAIVTAYLLAVTVPSIWVVISVVGSVAITVLCFIMPGLTLLAHRRGKQLFDWGLRVVAWVTIALGVLLFTTGIAGLVLGLHSDGEQ